MPLVCFAAVSELEQWLHELRHLSVEDLLLRLISNTELEPCIRHSGFVRLPAQGAGSRSAS
jgi:hypothetical protein